MTDAIFAAAIIFILVRLAILERRTQRAIRTSAQILELQRQGIEILAGRTYSMSALPPDEWPAELQEMWRGKI